MSATSTPHDALVRALLADRRFAAQILRVALPAEIAGLIDADRLELLEGSFVDASLNRSQSDALFRLRLRNGPVRVLYVLIEHKSRPDPDTALQMAGYLIAILRDIARTKTKRRELSAVLPVVLYHGLKRWTVQRTLFADPAANPMLAPYLPDFSYILFDLNAVDILSLPIDDTLKAVLLALKHARQPGDPEPWLRQVFAHLPENTLWESQVLTYILATVDTTRDIVLRAARAAQPNRWGTSMPTVAERLIEEGKQIGLIEGEARGRRLGLTEGEARGEARGRVAAIARVLAMRFGPLDAMVMLRLQALPAAALDTLLDRAVTADSLDAVFAPH